MRIERRDDIVILRLEAGKANAMSPQFLDGLKRLLEQAAGADAVVLTGYSKYFCAGLDLPTLLALDRPTMREFMGEFEQTMRRLLTLPVPVVAAINGHAVAGGCVLALQADYRIMAEGDYRIGLNETAIGLGLPRLVVETLRMRVPTSSLLPLALQGRLVEPAEALRLGLIDEMAPDDRVVEHAVEKARQLRSIPQPAYRQVKANLLRPYLPLLEEEAQSLDLWLDTWFSQAARDRIQQTLQRLGAAAS